MKLYKTIIKITITLVITAVPIAWLVATNSGLNTALSVASLFSPVKFSYKSSKGSVIGINPIEIIDLTFEYEGETLQVADFNVNWRKRSFTANNVRGFAKFLPKSELLADQQLVLNQINGDMQLLEQKNTWVINLIGKSANAAITGSLHARYEKSEWNLPYINLKVGKNTLVLKQQNLNDYSWDLKIVEPQVIFAQSSGSLYANGIIQNLLTQPNIKATVTSKKFILQDYQVKDLQANITIGDTAASPLDINIQSTAIYFSKNKVNNFRLSIAGNNTKHTIHANATYDSNIVNLTASAQLQNSIWESDDLALKINQQNFSGKTSYNIKKTNAKLELYANAKNYLRATLALKNNNINGELKVTASDIEFLMQFMPEVTRLKGKFEANARISGTISTPVIVVDAHLTEVTATLPRYGVKIKPLEIHIDGDQNGRFTLNGKGKMRRGPGSFTFNGYIEPFKIDMPNALNIIGDKVEFINNSTAHLIASNKIKLNYVRQEHRLDITGDIEIHEGNITIQDRSSQTVKTKDVVYSEQKTSHTKNLLINPHVNLRVIEGVKFTGFDLYADISGKINITQRNNIMYADGRITIKEGTYQLPGQKLSIQKGRILYPPGTSLTNPVLDIKMHGKSSSQESIKGSGHDVELSVYGTAHKPIISESGLTGKQDRAISRALLTGSSVISGNLLQDKLKISEIGLTGNDDPSVSFFNAPLKGNTLRNKDLVVGRPLSKKLYLQYLHSISEANQKVRLKYSLNRIWSIGVESGTQGGGADLSFSIER